MVAVRKGCLFHLYTYGALQIFLGDFEHDTIYIVSVDGTHCRTYEARKNPTAKVYSHKTHGPAVAYELGLAIYEDRLVWMNGPFDASTHDITIFRGEADDITDSGLKDNFPVGKRLIGDSGYKGEPNLITAHNDNHSKELTNFINRVRARHENFNARIKSYRCLSERFRSNRENHKIVFEAVCVLCQYDLENGHPLMEIIP
jgi:hypothetical protein